MTNSHKTGQVLMFPELSPPETKKVKWWPAVFIAAFFFGLTLAIVPYSFDYEKRHHYSNCKGWGKKDPKTGEQVCVNWSGQERVLR